jgi:hypothetical protein
MIAFSTDASVASRGVYLLSFLAQSEVDRVVDYAAETGRRSFAALIPDTTYGNVVEASFREAAARRGIRVAAVGALCRRAAATGRRAACPGLCRDAPQIDALFIPEAAEGLPAVGQALSAAGFNPSRVKPIGTGIWNDPRALRVPALAAAGSRRRTRPGSGPSQPGIAPATAPNRRGSRRFPTTRSRSQPRWPARAGVASRIRL